MIKIKQENKKKEKHLKPGEASNTTLRWDAWICYVFEGTNCFAVDASESSPCVASLIWNGEHLLPHGGEVWVCRQQTMGQVEFAGSCIAEKVKTCQTFSCGRQSLGKISREGWVVFAVRRDCRVLRYQKGIGEICWIGCAAWSAGDGMSVEGLCWQRWWSTCGV